MNKKHQNFENIEVFALNVAEIMDSLYIEFPIPINLPASELVESYGPSDLEAEPRIIGVDDSDYLELFSLGFDELSGLDVASGEGINLARNARKGQPYKYWTMEQRQAIKGKRLRQRHVEKIRNHTIKFLLREGFIKDVDDEHSTKRGYTPTLVITSKGFAQMNKQFEGGAISERFNVQHAKGITAALKTGSDVAKAGETLVRVLSAFFG